MERELVLLGLLRREAMHGYRLVERVERDLRSCTDLKKPTAYFLLGKLAKAGWATRSRTRDGKRPPKCVYRITPQGEARFQELLRQNLSAFYPATFVGDVGLAFLDALQADEATALLNLRRQELVQSLSGVEGGTPAAGSLRLVAEHRLVHLQAELEWLDDLLGRFAKPAGRLRLTPAGGGTAQD